LLGYKNAKSIDNAWFGLTMHAPWYVNKVNIIMLKPAQYTEIIAREVADYDATNDWIKLSEVIEYPADKFLNASFGTLVEQILMFIGFFMMFFPFPIFLIGMIIFFVALIIYKIFGKLFRERQKDIVIDID